MMKAKNLNKLLLLVIICLLVGFAGSVFTGPAVSSWYVDIIKPSFNPPNWLFGPVWTLLYILMGIAWYLVWNKDLKNKTVRFVFWLFSMHLIFNFLWSVIFFGLRNFELAFIEIAALWIFILYLFFAFISIDKRAGWLMIPYLLWVSFASVLNYAIWQLNY